jgi:competence protein ComGC
MKMKNENGVSYIILIIIMFLLVLLIFMLLGNTNDKYEKEENKVAGTINTQFESYDENFTGNVEAIDVDSMFANPIVVEDVNAIPIVTMKDLN